MSKQRTALDETKIEKLIKEGRGQNEGAAYKPWLTVRDVPSRGFSTRSKGWKTGRVHHVLSKLELKYLYVLEWSKSVVDIREQYPLLPLEETLSIAENHQIKHPTHPKTQKPVVLTTDFLITVSYDGQKVEQARTVKPFEQLQSERVLEKFEIERLYWKAKKIDWGIVTEHEIPTVLANNVDLLDNTDYGEDLPLSENEISDIALTLTQLLKENTIPLRHATQSTDHRLGFDLGTSLAVAYYLIANRDFQIDMDRPLQPGEPLVILCDNLAALQT